MKTAASTTALILLLLSALPAAAAPVGTSTSQSASITVNLDGEAYRLNTLIGYTRATQGLAVSIGQGTLFSTGQPAGAWNNTGFSETFTIPQAVIEAFY